MISPPWVWVISSSSACYITNNKAINSIRETLRFHLALEIRCININLCNRHFPCRVVDKEYNIKVASELILRHKVPLYYYSTRASTSQDINRLLSHSTFHDRHCILSPINRSTQALFNNGIFLPHSNSSLSSLIQDLTSFAVGFSKAAELGNCRSLDRVALSYHPYFVLLISVHLIDSF